jgi:hypothetical protein
VISVYDPLVELRPDEWRRLRRLANPSIIPQPFR